MRLMSRRIYQRTCYVIVAGRRDHRRMMLRLFGVSGSQMVLYGGERGVGARRVSVVRE